MDITNQNINESEYIIIPNPIYDVVFRYLMEDPDSAMIVISTLINEKIKKLHLEPLTHSEKNKPFDISTGSTHRKLNASKTKATTQDPKREDDIKLFHLDFTATIELPNGTEELVMIELQKASEPNDIFRFKRYISKNFQKKQKKEVTDPETQAIKTVNVPIRLIPIFILNFIIENEIDDLLIKTNRIKTGIFKNKKLEKHNDFIDNLSYDIWVVQLPNLINIKEDEYNGDEYKQKLYALLKLFDQNSKVKTNEHRLRLMRKFFPGFLDRVIKRLQAADIDNTDLEDIMNAEDEYLKVLLERDNRIAFLQEKVDKQYQALNEKYQALNEKDQALNEKDQALNEKDQLIAELMKKLNDKNK